MQRSILSVLFHALLAVSAFGQNQELPRDYFDPPLDIPLRLAGNFGEIRGNHFHAGIDIKTRQVEGLPVYAAAEGTVSRVKVGLHGYGKALYISHPNGYTTTYAHLQRFNEEIEAYVRERQYFSESYEVDLHPEPGELKIKRGEIVALSGNSGGSGGPHLHFEIRESAGQTPVNPLLFNFPVKDDIRPIIKTVSLYPMNDTSIVNGKNEPLHISVRGSRGMYHLPGPLELTARGVIGVGIEAIDKLNGAANRCGVYEISLIADGDTAYQHKMFRIPFALSRYINAHIDYYQTKKYRRRVQKSFLEPNNKLNIYTQTQFNGKLFFSAYDHDLHYIVKDAYGNTSSIQFEVKTDTLTPFVPASAPENSVFFNYKEENIFRTDNLRLRIPAYSLYNHLQFKYKKEPPVSGAVCDVYHLADLYTPSHKYMDVTLTLPDIPDRLRDKLYAVSLDENLKVISPEGGKFTGARSFSFRTRSFGPYTVLIDTAAPRIKPDFFGDAPVVHFGEKITFKIEDEESGIKTYRGTINGKWALGEYDYKTGEFSFEIDEKRIEKGMHNIKIEITDATGNNSTFETRFIVR